MNNAHFPKPSRARRISPAASCSPWLLVFTIAALTLNWQWALAEHPRPPRPPSHERLEQLDPEQRAALERRLNETWDSLPLEAKLRLMRIARALRDLPPEDRRLFHERIERFLNMSPEERERLRRNRERWERMTPEERERAREEFRKRRHEFERQWQPPVEPPPPPPPPPEHTD